MSSNDYEVEQKNRGGRIHGHERKHGRKHGRGGNNDVISTQDYYELWCLMG